jgi:hypothetical protein
MAAGLTGCLPTPAVEIGRRLHRVDGLSVVSLGTSGHRCRRQTLGLVGRVHKSTQVTARDRAAHSNRS